MASTTEFELTPQSLPDYLVSHSLAGPSTEFIIRELGGGVSNIVLLIEWANHPGRRWVAKQSLAKLRVKDDWRSDRERTLREAESIRALRQALGEAALPEIVHVDSENFLFLMTAAPAGSVVWKDSLLAGRIELPIAREAGLLQARLTNASRADAATEKRFRECFCDRTVFNQLRIDPYYRTTAIRHPDVKRPLDDLIAESWAIQTSLVHGDYSPKNMLVQKGQKIFLIDFEVIHWGDPAFDSGFLLNHLFLKALHQPRFAELYFEAAREFWRALTGELKNLATGEFEALTIRHLGGLMLARIDGKSPVEYIRDQPAKERVRRVAKQILLERPRCLAEVISLNTQALR